MFADPCRKTGIFLLRFFCKLYPFFSSLVELRRSIKVVIRSGTTLHQQTTSRNLYFDTKKFDEFLHQHDASFTEKKNASEYIASAQIKQSGFVAQEVEKVMKETGYDFNGLHRPETDEDYSMSYELLTVPMVKAIQELSAENIQLKQQLSDQQKQIDELSLMMQQLEQSMNGSYAMSNELLLTS